MSDGRWIAIAVTGTLAAAGIVVKANRGSLTKSNPKKTITGSWERLIEVAPVLYDEIEDAYWEEEGRDGATKMLKDLLEGSGFKTIGYGGSRVAVLLDNGQVAKVAAFDDGLRQNREELALFEILKIESPDMAKNLLVPAHEVEADGIVLRVDRAEPCTGASRKKCRHLIEEARKALSSNRMTRNLFDAEHDFNWGLHDGRVKILDYGQ